MKDRVQIREKWFDKERFQIDPDVIEFCIETYYFLKNKHLTKNFTVITTTNGWKTDLEDDVNEFFLKYPEELGKATESAKSWKIKKISTKFGI